MTTSTYGMLDSSSYDPKQFVARALKKIHLNNQNAIKYIKANDELGIKERLINSIHLLEELDMMLNREAENPTVDRVSNHYQWLMEVYEEILESLYDNSEETSKYIEKIESASVIVLNLFEGFSGMKDTGEDYNYEVN